MLKNPEDSKTIMVALTKKIIECHDIFVDTNILFNADKSLVANPEFDTFWQEHSPRLELYLKIPSVVIGELLYQQTSSSLRTLKKANDEIEKLKKITPTK
ncbi:hypothetical protein [Microbulbifer sp. JMSA002]|uniref:hypothetical protein n=1 Tax=Microbulbifer sp. JMSA002 TaxID=3243368 RepID=UPI00403A0CD3